MTDRLALDAEASRVLLCSQSFSKNTLKSADLLKMGNLLLTK